MGDNYQKEVTFSVYIATYFVTTSQSRNIMLNALDNNLPGFNFLIFLKCLFTDMKKNRKFLLLSSSDGDFKNVTFSFVPKANKYL